MKNARCLVAVLALMALVTMPAAAMTSDTLDISIRQDGRADIQFRYSLDWIEYIAVYLRMVDPAQELRKALESNFHKPVEVISVDSGTVILSVDSFANLTERGGVTTARVPGLDFTEGERILKNYWFAPLVRVDLSPAVTRFHFPDGSETTFADAAAIPPQVRSW